MVACWWLSGCFRDFPLDPSGAQILMKSQPNKDGTGPVSGTLDKPRPLLFFSLSFAGKVFWEGRMGSKVGNTE